MTAAVVWFTGLPGSGKSTLAGALCERLRARGTAVELLDGDAVREVFPGTGFTREARDAHVKRVGWLASRLEAHGVAVLCAFVSPYAEARRWVRSRCRRFVEVHVATPLSVCEARDPKGLYARARAGEIERFTGVSDPYEAPTAPEVRVEAVGGDPGPAVTGILAALDRGA